MFFTSYHMPFIINLLCSVDFLILFPLLGRWFEHWISNLHCFFLNSIWFAPISLWGWKYSGMAENKYVFFTLLIIYLETWNCLPLIIISTFEITRFPNVENKIFFAWQLECALCLFSSLLSFLLCSSIQLEDYLHKKNASELSLDTEWRKH